MKLWILSKLCQTPPPQEKNCHFFQLKTVLQHPKHILVQIECFFSVICCSKIATYFELEICLIWNHIWPFYPPPTPVLIFLTLKIMFQGFLVVPGWFFQFTKIPQKNFGFQVDPPPVWTISKVFFLEYLPYFI